MAAKKRPSAESQPLSAEDITTLATESGLHQRWLRGKLEPWKVVEQMVGDDDSFGERDKSLWSWYEENQPKKTLAALQESDPARYAELVECQAKTAQFNDAVRNSFQNRRSGDSEAELDSLYKSDLAKAAETFAAFTRAALDSHRIDDIYGDIQEHKELFNYMYYALLRNEETGDYLSVMIDARHNLRLDEKYQPNFVKIEPVATDGRTDEEVLEQAHWQWAEHLLYRNRYAPHYEESIVTALEEADRLRAKFNGAAVEERPAVRKELFDFYPAFARAYRGEGGYFQALVDVYGPKGNVRHCSDMGVAHNHWDYSRYNNGGETGRKYEISGDKFLKLYEQMGKKEKADFEKAFDRFVKDVLPTIIDDIEDKGNKGFGITQDTTSALTYLKIAIDYGSGALETADWFKTFKAIENEMMDIAGRERKWASRYDKPADQRAPKF